MAELLIKKTNVTNSDIVKDLRACYKRGMVVGVRPDGHHYSDGNGIQKQGYKICEEAFLK